MPQKSTPNQIKNPKQYEDLRKEGMSKEKAARISNAGWKASVKSGKNPTYRVTKQLTRNKVKRCSGFKSLIKRPLL